MVSILYDIRMLQVNDQIPGEYYSGSKPILDCLTACRVALCMRRRMYSQYPFFLTEMANIITRLSQQGLVNPDIKIDNITVSGMTGQPKMIDFNLIFPAHSKESRTKDTVYSPPLVEDARLGRYPQSAPEYLNRKFCSTSVMTYGLGYLLLDVANRLVMRIGDAFCVGIYTNPRFIHFINRCRDPEPENRPSCHELGPIMGSIFPFDPIVLARFNNPKLYIDGK